ncbi:hypothetical protein [Streptomyces sp. NPDC088785]|uniref:hypothetical protein n=1 Tax=Streptomyces sp. NPDC088785 TaxID=3365897 RepID=UPI00382343E4
MSLAHGGGPGADPGPGRGGGEGSGTGTGLLVAGLDERSGLTRRELEKRAESRP